MTRSLRSRLILASVLWTAGLMGLIHGASILLMRARFPYSHVLMLSSAAVMIAGLVAALWSWTPFSHLIHALKSVRMGRSTRVAGRYPSEVQPLVDDMNALLEDRERAVQRALAVAGDLAHGLKTPLALLAQHADVHVAEQVERMNRQVRYHLARARASASGTAAAPCAVAPCVEAVMRTVMKLHAAKVIAVTIDVPGDLTVRVQVEDLEEMLGNLLDNACKWTRSRVAVSAAREEAMMRIVIDDDGSGLAPALCTRVLERGVRADEAMSGWGLGLAIVRDLAEIYGGSVELTASPLGGLQCRLSLRSDR